ncbi:hypothetical protein [Neisseria iguanae]|uniref:DUF202 domain-containing protein n=1 Tax=Neisseria iguanae TaxID=90242 RepID=A0A2P7TZ13_9NEIS|nr:hypothetical protein [Neisseria iguanae]PSJ79968.1 hypothetical protein C7N83_09110 [Neisseria iguanae]
MKTEIDGYRAPMVTAIGIILGFVLAFMSKWATEPGTTHKSDYLVLIGLLIGIVLLITALYRILNNRVADADQAHYYGRTLQIFMVGLVCSFIGTLLAIIQQLLL